MIKSKYTIALGQIIEDNIVNIFDFDYSRTPESIAILSNEDLQKGFIDHFYFREICCETVERFKHYLKTQWKESLGEFDKWLVAYNDPVNVKTNFKSSGKSRGVSNDTPMSEIDFTEETNHASFIQHNNQENAGYSGITESELLEIFHKNTRDIQTEFYNSFDNLFMQIF